MAITTLDDHFEHMNPALCKITGYPREQLEGMAFSSITPPEDLVSTARSRTADQRRASVHRTEKRYIHADAHLVPIEISATLVRDSDGEPLNFLTQIQDITEREAVRGPAPAPRRPRLAHRSLQPPPLRGGALRASSPSPSVTATRRALLAIDLDNFKYINDSLGHSIGDELIVRVGEALYDRLRKTDVLARLGGDEFAVILPRADEHDASAWRERCSTRCPPSTFRRHARARAT